MSKEITPQDRQYAGPARLVSDNHTERMLYERVGSDQPYADFLTECYGERGIGWDFDTTDPRHAERNASVKAAHTPEFALATEGFLNLTLGLGYVSNEGYDLKKAGLTRRAARPATGNIVVYPDGDIYRTENDEAA
jgi:hypothetical protein